MKYNIISTLAVKIYHNYVRLYMGLDGKTPAEACGIETKKRQMENSDLDASVQSQCLINGYIQIYLCSDVSMKL
ncbi:hypothetical protein [Nitrosopumilus ureiphilus]|uniref:Uncharacterized protein n=1 Tax=Nitrosopumilus ureiphilus TaxID=1470067 RepID=A0A7D5R2R9_9ARCH|nr:hypothetical protein [Nitrosopumilus ureiphilus]QLH07696.1 hypothetical protein C5F50_11905 [Nitrosopumilus ureiphilus]